MKVMVMVNATKSSEAGVMPTEQLLTEMGHFNEELVKAGIMLAGEGLHPSSRGVRVRFSGSNRIVTDGPFVETNELVAGYWLWNVKSMQEAIDWVKRCPNPMLEDSEIEIRGVFSAEDFGAEFTPELREQEASQRARVLGLDPRFENGREMLIAGFSATVTPDKRHLMPELWGRMCPHLGKVPGQAGPGTYSICWNFQAGCTFDYLAGVEVRDTKQLPEGFTHLHIPARRYAVFTHHEHVSKLPDTYEIIWSKWAPESGLKTAEAPIVERYTEKFNPETLIGGTEIWIPLQS